MKHIRIEFIIAFVLWALWMALMFSYSDKPADVSEGQSHLVGEVILRFIDGDFDSLSLEERQARIECIDFAVRKTAHAFEYTVLGILTICVMLNMRPASQPETSTLVRRKLMAVACCWGIFFAITDEIHQTCVPGRAGKWQDVLLDTGGTILGVALVALILWGVRKRRAKAEAALEAISE